ncbi:hypothetical protein LCGC14_0614620 [marine sediment metagenome]|uniref:Uncharacterized protein n=1 Tax=marine sediment metagenome TaxID=412755 RepID=A0A0F9RQV8_9ZZZZ
MTNSEEIKDLTEKEIEIAYVRARKEARVFHQTHFMPTVTIEDYVQDCMEGWLKGHNMYLSLLDSFRRLAPLTRYQFKKDPFIPQVVHHTGGNIVDDEETVAKIEQVVLLSQLREIIPEKVDTVTAVIMDRYYFHGDTLAEIAYHFDRSTAWVHDKKEQGLCLMKGALDD